MSFEIALSAVSIIIGAIGSIAGAVSMIYINKLKTSKTAEVELQKLNLQQQRMEHKEHDTIFEEYRMIVETTKSMHDFIRNEIVDLKKDMEELQNDRRNCRKENDELRKRVIQLEEEIIGLKRKLFEQEVNGIQPRIHDAA
jgi:predicted  nucleic acid-binding Zn-ribbon protein